MTEIHPQSASVREGISASFGIALIVKCLLFGAACVAIPRMSLEWYGVHMVHLFFFVTLTSWARNECFRKVILRFPSGSYESNKSRLNLERLSFWTTAIVTQVAWIIWLLFPPELVRTTKQTRYCYYMAIGMHNIASILSAFAEPFYLDNCFASRYREKAWTESLGALTFSMVFFVPFLLLKESHDWVVPMATLLLSGLAQIAWAASFLIGMVGLCDLPAQGCLNRALSTCLFPEPLSSSRWLCEDQKQSLSTEVKTGIQKWVLSEADKLLMMRYMSPTSQGALAMVQNLGSMLLRVVFIHQEDILAIHYSSNRLPNKSVAEAWTYEDFMQYFDVFRIISYVEWSFGLSAALFGPHFAGAALQLAYGPDAAIYAPLLARYFVLIGILSFTGILEGFCNAVASIEWIAQAQSVCRVAWILGTVVSVVIWELMIRVPPLEHVVDPTTIWIVSSGFFFLARCIVPIRLIWNFVVTTRSKKMPIHQALAVLTYRGWPGMLGIFLLGNLCIKWAPSRLSFADSMIAFVPSLLHRRLQPTPLATGACLGLAIVLGVFVPLNTRHSGWSSKYLWQEKKGG